MMKNFFRNVFKTYSENHYKLHFFVYVLTLFVVFNLFDLIGYELEMQPNIMMKLLYFFIANFVAEVVSRIIIAMTNRRA